MKRSGKTQALFFDVPHGRLFGVYHEPEGRLVRAGAVLLLYPGEQEYKMVHWAYRNLAVQLAKQGWPVLRFDYTGTGDSDGETGTGDLDLWLEDAVAAADFLKKQSGCLHLQVVGVRLGAVVAARLAGRTPVLNTILWDPPATGKSYLADLDELELGQRATDRFHRIMAPLPLAGDMAWSFGFALPRAARGLIESLDWRTETVPSPFKHLVLSKGQEIIDLGQTPVSHVDESIGWGQSRKCQEALLAPRAISAICRLIGDPTYA